MRNLHMHHIGVHYVFTTAYQQGVALKVSVRLGITLTQRLCIFKGLTHLNISFEQGLRNDFQVGGARAPRPGNYLPPKFNFLLGFRPLNFENADAKQKILLNIVLLHFSVKVEGRRSLGLKVGGGGATAPAAPPRSRAHGFEYR